MDTIILNVFLGVLIIGVSGIIGFFVIQKIFSPKKFIQLRNAIKTGNYKLAIKYAKEILAKDRNNFEAHYYLGQAYYNEGKFELALIEFKSADRIGHVGSKINELDLREKLAELYIKFEKYDEALKEYAMMLKKKEDDYFINYKMGELFEFKNQNQQALSYYSKSLKAKNNYPPVLIKLGILLYDVKKYNESEKLLLRALKYEPDNYQAFYYLGMIYKNQSDFKKALDYFEKSSKSKDMKVKSLAERGMIQMLSNNFEEACIEFERALKYSEGESLNLVLNIRYMLAASYENIRNITEAIKEWEIIYSIKADFKNVSEKLANYQDLRMDDKMKDYMTATNTDFFEITRKIVAHLNYKIDDKLSVSNDSIELVVLDAASNWRSLKKKPKLLKIFRKSDPVDERILREVIDTMKKNEFFKGIIISSSSFSNQAVTYASERPLELIDKNELQNILKNINLV